MSCSPFIKYNILIYSRWEAFLSVMVLVDNKWRDFGLLIVYDVLNNK